MILQNAKIALPGSPTLQFLDIETTHGKIVRIGENLTGNNNHNLSGLEIYPGAIDSHVHFNDPGFTDREDFYHGSCAAVSGGITTVIDMPCTSLPPIISLDNLFNKLNIIKTKSLLDFGFYGGISKQVIDNNYKEIIANLAEYVMGFKCYLISSMNTFGSLNIDELTKAMIEVKKHNRPILLHAEDPATVIELTKIEKLKSNDWINYYRSRPEKAELIAIKNAIAISKKTGCQLHIVHVGSGDGAILISNEPNVTGETCPHYLQYNYMDFAKVGGSLKTVPVVKTARDSKMLWQCIIDGKLDFITSDHAPAPATQKNTGSAWTDHSGIPGTGTLFPYLYSEGLVKRHLPLPRFLQLISENAAKRYNIFNRKGSIEIGKDADFVVVNPKQQWKVKGKNFFSKGKLTPFENMILEGKVVKTIIRGNIIYDYELGIVVDPGYGEFLKPGCLGVE